MSVNSININVPTGSSEPTTENNSKKVSIKTQEEFDAAMERIEEAKENGTEPAKADLEGVFSFTFRRSLVQQNITAQQRHMQDMKEFS